MTKISLYKRSKSSNWDQKHLINTFENEYNSNYINNPVPIAYGYFKANKKYEIFQGHQQIYKRLKSHMCDICKKSFKHICHLKKHLRIHTGEKPYVCNLCGWGFTQACNLSQHQRTHTGEKPYSCKICKKRFTQCGTLNRHKRIHLRESVYS